MLFCVFRIFYGIYSINLENIRINILTLKREKNNTKWTRSLSIHRTPHMLSRSNAYTLLKWTHPPKWVITKMMPSYNVLYVNWKWNGFLLSVTYSLSCQVDILSTCIIIAVCILFFTLITFYQLISNLSYSCWYITLYIVHTHIHACIVLECERLNWRDRDK